MAIKGKRKKSLVGWTHKGWNISWNKSCGDIDSPPITRIKSTWNKDYKLVRIKITIEEI